MDVTGFRSLNGLAGRADWFDALARAVTNYGAFVMLVIMAVYWIWPGEVMVRRKRQRVVLYAGLSAGIALGVSQVIGRIWTRPRPFIDHHAILLVPRSTDPSFPSDHATGAFAIAAIFVLASWRLGIPMMVLATAIAISRVIVGTHYPGDVLGGALLGSICAYGVWRIRYSLERVVAPCLAIAHRMHLAT